jgi:hypothetical protein
MRDGMPFPIDVGATPTRVRRRPRRGLGVVGTAVLAGLVIATACARTEEPADTKAVDRSSSGPRAYFEQDAEGEHSQQDYVYRLRITLKRHPGTWEDGTRFGVRLQLKEPCLRWTIDPEHVAFGEGTEVLKEGPRENTSLIEYSAIPKMRPSANVTIDIDGATPPEIVEGAWRPMAKDVQ